MHELHLGPLPGPPERPEVLRPRSLFSAMGLHVPYTSRALYSFFPRSGWGVAGPEGRWRRGGRVFLLWEASQAAKLFSEAQGSQETQLLAAAEGGGGRTIGGGPGLGLGVNVHRLSVPTPGQVALQGGPVFTCLLSQVAQTRAPFRSSEPGGGPGVPGLPHPHSPPPHAACWGRGRSKQQQTRHRKVILETAERPGHTPCLGPGSAGCG